MKKLIYMLALGLLYCATGCEDEPGNPGDFSVKSVLEIGAVTSLTTGDEYSLTVAREIDSTYMYSYTVNDTVKDENGEPEIGADGNYIINTEIRYYPSRVTARFIEMEPITLASSVDTFSIALKSNARWLAPVPDAGGKVQWYYNVNSTTGGGGDGAVNFRVTRNRNYTRAVDAVQYIHTQDSTVMYKLVFKQAGEKD